MDRDIQLRPIAGLRLAIGPAIVGLASLVAAHCWPESRSTSLLLSRSVRASRTAAAPPKRSPAKPCLRGTPGTFNGEQLTSCINTRLR